MIKSFPVYQIVDHPKLVKKLSEVCILTLNDADIESISKLSDLGDRLYLLTEDAVRGLSDCHSVAATILAIDTGVPYVIDLKEAFT